MGQVMEHSETIDGYEAVPLALPGQAGLPDSGAAVLRRRSARPGRRAVMYVHCRGDAFVPDDLVGWYTDRGFHFYAADLREIGADERQPAGGHGPVTEEPGRQASGGSGGRPPGQHGNQAAQDLADCFTCLDAAATHVRGADAIDTMVVSAHGAGAVIAALWCHARRGSRPADALVLASPSWATAPSWPEWPRAAARRPAPVRPSPLLTGARRRLRRGLDIACPVLVMCPATGWNAPGGAGGLLVPRTLARRRATMRLGEHVTWLKLPGGLPGEVRPQGPGPVTEEPGRRPAGGSRGVAPPDQHDAGRRRVCDELGRWLSAYLSGQIRDQLL
jgi:hypothetical protein